MRGTVTEVNKGPIPPPILEADSSDLKISGYLPIRNARSIFFHLRPFRPSEDIANRAA